MKVLSRTLVSLLAYFTLGIGTSFAATINQTASVSPVLPATGLPFRVVIEQAGFQLPVGIHSGVFGQYKGLWIFIAGRINGLHGFGPDPFPPDTQSTRIYVVNSVTGAVNSRSLSDPRSGLSQKQIDTLSVTSPEGYQEENTLYMVGGYGIDTATATFTTKSVLTAFNLPGIVDWVMGNGNTTLAQNITQTYNATFQVTGGRLDKLGNTMQLVFGQDFEGVYDPSLSGNYTQVVRQFEIQNTGGQLTVNILNSMPYNANPDFRRRDLNIVPVIMNNNNHPQNALVAYAGVFTTAGGVWTVPVVINGKSNPTMADPTLSSTFKQAMNQYVCATAGLYSRKNSSMYNIFFGGISYGFFSNGTIQFDDEDPFINQVTTIQIDQNGNFTQYLMASQYPTILSTQSNPGNPLLFGAGAYFIPNKVLQYPNRVMNLDSIRQPTVIGYIVGGIQSTLPNTNVDSDSAASPYVFKVTLIPT